MLGISVEQLVDNWTSASRPFPEDERIQDVATDMLNQLLHAASQYFNRRVIETILNVYVHLFQSMSFTDTRFACAQYRLDPTCNCGLNGVTYWLRNCRINHTNKLKLASIEAQYYICSSELAAKSALTLIGLILYHADHVASDTDAHGGRTYKDVQEWRSYDVGSMTRKVSAIVAVMSEQFPRSINQPILKMYSFSRNKESNPRIILSCDSLIRNEKEIDRLMSRLIHSIILNYLHELIPYGIFSFAIQGAPDVYELFIEGSTKTCGVSRYVKIY